MSPTSNGFPPTPHSWGLEKVGFSPAGRVRTSDQATPRSIDISGGGGGALGFSPLTKPRPIAIIDVGGAALDNPLLAGRTEYVSPHALRPATPAGSETHGAHAAEVAGVIASACAADLIVYNIGTTAGWDRELFVAALDNIVHRDPKPAVVNISVGWHHQVVNKSQAEIRAEAAVEACIKSGISVVVAMGEYAASSDLEWFPAVTDGVIAVGASDYNDLRFPDSDLGDHVWIAAPGEDILTVVNSDDFGSRSGTSFAAALVSAAVWLSLQADEKLTPAQIRKKLGNSAESTRVPAGSPPEPRKGPDNGKWDRGVGCGRLDVPNFMMTVSPAAAAAFSVSSEVRRSDDHAGAEREVATMVASEKPLNKSEGVVEPRKPDTDAGLSGTA